MKATEWGTEKMPIARVGHALQRAVPADPKPGEQQLLTRDGQDELFCQLYLKSLSPSRSAATAYNMSKELASAGGWLKLTEPGIASRVAYLAEQHTQKLGVHPVQIIDHITNIAFADNMDIFTDEQMAELGLGHMEKEQRMNIAAIDFDALYEWDTDPETGKKTRRIQIGNRVKIKWYSKEKALEMLARVCALFQDRIPDPPEAPKDGLITSDNADIIANKIMAVLSRAQHRMIEDKKDDGEKDDGEGLL